MVFVDKFMCVVGVVVVVDLCGLVLVFLCWCMGWKWLNRKVCCVGLCSVVLVGSSVVLLVL